MSSAALPSVASLPLKVAGFHKLNLRRIVYTPQSALLGALHLTPCWCPGLPKIHNHHCLSKILMMNFGPSVLKALADIRLTKELSIKIKLSIMEVSQHVFGESGEED
jgi:hypothetical protein